MPITNRSRWIGRAVTAFIALFLMLDAAMKLLQLPPAVEATTDLGYPASTVPIIGAIEAVCLALYLWPRTAVLGVILWVGYFGGAVATHVRAGSPLVTHTLFPLVLAAFMWVGLWLRNDRARRVTREAFAGRMQAP